ncbi:putative B3 domain-containing protein At3g49610 [Magnolia sinica]|uniref:putative B3 domain-containing protein At3g49610 n=1 Tax=Magnolia sinica TaxID=86752 RepID=UPI00265A9E51|nr:putative B3 domain-containing protein At3g49610 [Magnolia sinica]
MKSLSCHRSMKRKENEKGEEEEKMFIPCWKKSKAEIQEELRGGSCSDSSSKDPKLDFDTLTRIASLENAKHQSLKIFLKNKTNNREIQISCGKKPCLPLPEWGSWIQVYLKMGGGDLVYLCNKTLTASDVMPNLCRLFLKTKEALKVLIPAMTKCEEKRLMDPKEKFIVIAVDQMGRQYNIELQYWSSVHQYVFQKGWKKLVMENGFGNDTNIRIWFFRYGKNKELGFIVIPSYSIQQLQPSSRTSTDSTSTVEEAH